MSIELLTSVSGKDIFHSIGIKTLSQLNAIYVLEYNSKIGQVDATYGVEPSTPFKRV